MSETIDEVIARVRKLPTLADGKRHAMLLADEIDRLRAMVAELQRTGTFSRLSAENDALGDERDALKAQLEEMRASIVKCCGLCNGTGRWTPHCSRCDDSTEDHNDCPAERPCEHTITVRKALSPCEGG